MNHQDLAYQFCGFVYKFLSEINDIKFINKTDEIFYRVCFQKLYYALYHKMLHHNSDLSESEAPGKHEKIMERINHSRNDQLKQIYSKMKALRIWADYETNSIPPLNPPNIEYYQNQVFQILKRTTINI